jgi:hypothetical protein
VEGPNCEVIGHSVDVDIAQETGSDVSGFALSHDLLQRLLGRYPFGHVFSYDELGAVLQPPSSKDGQERRHPSRAVSNGPEVLARPSEAEDAAELLNATILIPEGNPASSEAAVKSARSIAFTTLWDYRNDKWFAASISKYTRYFYQYTRR